MPSFFLPRLSQAKDLFPIVRKHLAAAAALHSLPAGLSIDLVPIVEDGLTGYEILPNRSIQTYLTVGWDHRGKPVLRESNYLDRPRLSVAAVNGQAAATDSAAHRQRQRDSVLPDWPTAAEAVWSALARLFPQEPRCAIELHDLRHKGLDEALATACRHLGARDPHIDFCGVPGEAQQYGFALTDPHGGRGQLVARHPETWTLSYQSPLGTVHEEWAMMPGSSDATDRWGYASLALPTAPSGRIVATLPAASQRMRRRDRDGDRRQGDRRRADRRQTLRFYEERRQGERRQSDRRQPWSGGAPIPA